MDEYRVFVSHGGADLWLAGQIAKELAAMGVVPFLDETSIPKADPNFKQVIREQVALSRELVALFTPWSARRSWVWIEMGAAWGRGIPILAVFYGMEVGDLDKDGQGKAIIEDINVVSLNDIDKYFLQLRKRVDEVVR